MKPFNATELYIFKVKIINIILCIFYYNLKNRGKVAKGRDVILFILKSIHSIHTKMSVAAILRKGIFGWSPLSFNHFFLFS